MLRIPQKTLERMTNAALVRAIYEFPYVADYMLYDSAAEEGIMVMLSYFSAPEELKSRQLSPEALLSLAAPYEFMLRNIPDNEYSEVRIHIISTLDILNVLAGCTAEFGLLPK